VQPHGNNVLPLMRPFPEPQSVLILDNASIHLKMAVVTACQLRGVLCFYLPPYSYHYSAIELLFHCAKEYIRNKYGVVRANSPIGALLEEALWNCVSPEIACNMFDHVYIVVSAVERQTVQAL
jgi:hypothetical protein